MRFVYVDESGTSARESVALVSGVCVDPDRQMIALEDRLSQLADKHVPTAKRPGFVFHATELFSGGKTFDRVNFPPPVRWPILDQVAAIPREMGVTVVNGFIYKKRGYPQDEITHHAMAFLWCLISIEIHMRTRLNSNEIAIVVVEDKPEARWALKRSREILGDPKFSKLQPEHIRQFIPLTRIRDTIHFAKKSESPLLQVADTCAYVTRREMEGAPDNERFAGAYFGDAQRPNYSDSTIAGLFELFGPSTTQEEAEQRAGERFHLSLFEKLDGPVTPIRGPSSDWRDPDFDPAFLDANPPVERQVYVRIADHFGDVSVEHRSFGVVVTAHPNQEIAAKAVGEIETGRLGLDKYFLDRPLPPQPSKRGKRR